jgi:hypothetical protein
MVPFARLIIISHAARDIAQQMFLLLSPDIAGIFEIETAYASWAHTSRRGLALRKCADDQTRDHVIASHLRPQAHGFRASLFQFVAHPVTSLERI